MVKKTHSGIRVHDSIRGADGAARRVLIVGHEQVDLACGSRDDLFVVDARDARELRTALDEFIVMAERDGVRSFPRAQRTSADHEIYESRPIPR